MKLHKNQSGFSHIEIFLVVIVVVLIGAVGWMVYDRQSDKNDSSATATKQISNFDECAAAGNPIMETYPEQCAANGKTFTKGVAGQSVDTNKYLAVEEWKVKFEKRQDTPSGITYKVKDASLAYGDGAQELKFFSSARAKLGISCNNEEMAALRIVRSNTKIIQDTPPLPEPKIISNTYYYIIGDKSGGSCVDGVKEGDSSENNPAMAEDERINETYTQLAETIQNLN